jgi:hypothetical protein
VDERTPDIGAGGFSASAFSMCRWPRAATRCAAVLPPFPSGEVLPSTAYHANIIAYTATRFDLEALEDPGLGHGLFSYAVVEGLEGKGWLAGKRQISTEDATWRNVDPTVACTSASPQRAARAGAPQKSAALCQDLTHAPQQSQSNPITSSFRVSCCG